MKTSLSPCLVLFYSFYLSTSFLSCLDYLKVDNPSTLPGIFYKSYLYITLRVFFHRDEI